MRYTQVQAFIHFYYWEIMVHAYIFFFLDSTWTVQVHTSEADILLGQNSQMLTVGHYHNLSF